MFTYQPGVQIPVVQILLYKCPQEINNHALLLVVVVGLLFLRMLLFVYFLLGLGFVYFIFYFVVVLGGGAGFFFSVSAQALKPVKSRCRLLWATRAGSA